jgi:hypothetical protein
VNILGSSTHAAPAFLLLPFLLSLLFVHFFLFATSITITFHFSEACEFYSTGLPCFRLMRLMLLIPLRFASLRFASYSTSSSFLHILSSRILLLLPFDFFHLPILVTLSLYNSINFHYHKTIIQQKRDQMRDSIIAANNEGCTFSPESYTKNSRALAKVSKDTRPAHERLIERGKQAHENKAQQHIQYTQFDTYGNR